MKKINISPKAFLSLLALMLFWPALFGIYYLGYSLYCSMDQTRFPKVSEQVTMLVKEAGDNPDEKTKGAILLSSIHARLDQEMDSSFGWSVNDLFFMPTRYLDNRNNRQKGVIFGARMLLRFYSLNMAKLGAADPENEYLKECREKRLVYGEDIWGFFRASSEGEYKKAVSLMDKYAAELKSGKGVFNCRTDDIYNVLMFIISEECLGQPMGLLIQTNDEVDYFDLDDRIYYSQGVVMVVRDFLYALVALYPEITEKGGSENIKVAFREMDRICDFDPLLVLRGDHDSLLADHRGKMARYLITVQKRIADLAQSVRR